MFSKPTASRKADSKIKAKARSIGYSEKENSLPRSLLYPKRKNDMYVYAMAQYLLGDKKRFLEMLLPQDIVERQRFGGNFTSVDVTLRELFDYTPESFNEIDEKSVLCHKNSYIYVLWLQTKVPEDVLEIEDFKNCKSKEELLQKYTKWKASKKRTDSEQEQQNQPE